MIMSPEGVMPAGVGMSMDEGREYPAIMGKRYVKADRGKCGHLSDRWERVPGCIEGI
jgi:hypothetical protein